MQASLPPCLPEQRPTLPTWERMHLDRRLTWGKHIFTKRKQMGLTFNKMYWLLEPKSKLSVNNTLLIYKPIIKPMWSYGIQLWDSSSTCNIEILQRFQLKTLRMIIKAPWFVSNVTISKDLQMPTIKEEICRYSTNYKACLSAHPNKQSQTLWPHWTPIGAQKTPVARSVNQIFNAFYVNLNIGL